MKANSGIKLYLTLLLSAIYCGTYSQRNDKIWYFGDRAGISFANNSPEVLLDGKLETLDNASTISDAAGNLLFYTNGVSIWNKSHAIMENGEGLLGSMSAGQSVLIVPSPGTENYYVFTVPQTTGTSGLRFSVVNLSTNGGMGAVIEKNTKLLDRTTEKLEAVRSIDGSFYWLIAHGWNNNKFYTYRIDHQGIDLNPVVSEVGTVHEGNVYNSMGQMTLSPDASKLALGIYSAGIIEIFDFNISTGLVSNPKTINGQANPWGVAFSGDGKKLYSTSWFGKSIYQFTVESGDIHLIKASKISVGEVSGPGTAGYFVGYLQLAPDMRIYAAKFDAPYLATIEYPNLSASNCGFNDNGFFLGNRVSKAGLTRAPLVVNCATTENQRSYPKPFDPCNPASNLIEIENEIQVWPNPVENEVNVWFTDAQSKLSISWVLRDNLGRDVSGAVQQVNSLEKITLNITGLSKGIYWLSLNNGKRNYYARIFKPS